MEGDRTRQLFNFLFLNLLFSVGLFSFDHTHFVSDRLISRQYISSLILQSLALVESNYSTANLARALIQRASQVDPRHQPVWIVCRLKEKIGVRVPVGLLKTFPRRILISFCCQGL